MRETAAMFTSTRHDWETPDALFQQLDREFDFTLDAAAGHDNAKVFDYFTEDDDALRQPWHGRVFLNPPFGADVGRWVDRAANETWNGAAEVSVLLIPARVDTRWWHDAVMHADEIRFIRGRVRFVGASYNAPFPCAVVVFRRWCPVPQISTLCQEATR